MHTVFALLCFVVVIHWLIFPYPSGLLHWHCGNLTIAPVPAKQPWWIWINTSCEFIMNDCTTTTKQSTTKPCAYFLGYTVFDVYSKTLYNQHKPIFDRPWTCKAYLTEIEIDRNIITWCFFNICLCWHMYQLKLDNFQMKYEIWLWIFTASHQLAIHFALCLHTCILWDPWCIYVSL